MCGILFLLREGKSKAALLNSAGRALDRMSHRGPDDEGVICEPPWVIGHRRLSIIDIAGSRQPMADPEKRYMLSYNGEIYNYKELRKALRPAWHFSTRGDTEVVLAGLVCQGVDFLSKMEGMWALALWDTQTQTLLLSRDRMGKKPLYYQPVATGFACASELMVLSCLRQGPWEEDLDSSADYFRFGYYLPGKTSYKGVYEVLPGNALRWNVRAGVQQFPYWSLPVGGYSGSFKGACEQLRERLIRAVERRLVADVEVGAFLSGGIDSSLIVAILSREFGLKPKTFTIGFEEASYDESAYARRVATLFQTDHFAKTFYQWDREKLVDLILSHAGQPFADVSILPTSMVSSVAAERVKVALSGDGGDELFSGYQRYMARTLLRWYTRLPYSLRQQGEKLLQAIPEPMAHHSRSILKKAHLFVDIVKRQKVETPYTAPVLYSYDDFQYLLPDLCNKGHDPPAIPGQTEKTDIGRMMVADALIYLPQDILAKVDRASMAYSLEARAPYLDQSVVELAFSLPNRWHRRCFSGKRMLRRTFSSYLPRDIWRRRKQGFGVPIHAWFQGELSNQLVALLEHLHTPLNKKSVQAMIRDHQAGKRDHGYRLWNIYIYLLWLHHKPWQTS